MKNKTLITTAIILSFCSALPVFAEVKATPEKPTRSAQMEAPKTGADSHDIPEEAYDDMQTLVTMGMVNLPAGVMDVRSGNFTRNDMAILTMQAMDATGAKDASIDGLNHDIFLRRQGAKEVLDLKRIFTPELKNYGMKAKTLAASTKMSSEAKDLKKSEERDWKISGELRYSYDHNTGADKYQWNDSRIRARVYLEAKINDDWHAFGMVEGNKHFLDDHHTNDDWFEHSRIYVRGLTGATILTAGRYGYMLGEGNIYDSSITGITANVGEPINYEATKGKTEADGKMAALIATYKNERAEYGVGYSKFDEDDWGTGDKQIGHAWVNYHVGKAKVGIMGLTSDKEDADGRKNGFVASAQYGRLQSWKPGSSEFDIKYYRQPVGTYVAHTMTGLGGYMQGFRGPGAMWYYTLFPNTVLGIEYYDLNDLVTDEKGRTLWTQVSFYF